MSILAHRIQLEPTTSQQQAFRKACGVARFTYNWILEQCEVYRNEHNGKLPNLYELKRRWNAEKPSWVRESPRDANSQPFSDAKAAFSNFFRERKKGNKKAGYPKFKKRGKCRDSFYVANDKFSVSGQIVRLPVIGKVVMTEELRFAGKIMHGTVSREADRWFLSVAVEGEFSRKRTGDEIIGVDLGVKSLATLSTGEVIEGPKPLKSATKRLKRLQRQLSRKQKGSANRAKAQMRLARQHRKVKNLRNDALHKLTTRLCRRASVIVIEDLNVCGMLKNHKLARTISDMGWGYFRRQLEYKSQLFDVDLVVADRWFPSSKICSSCGQVVDSLALSVREYVCGACGMAIDRDLNAAVNLRTLGLRETSSSDGTPVDTEALAAIRRSETIVDEAGTFSVCILAHT